MRVEVRNKMRLNKFKHCALEIYLPGQGKDNVDVERVKEGLALFFDVDEVRLVYIDANTKSRQDT